MYRFESSLEHDSCHFINILELLCSWDGLGTVHEQRLQRQRLRHKTKIIKNVTIRQRHGIGVLAFVCWILEVSETGSHLTIVRRLLLCRRSLDLLRYCL